MKKPTWDETEEVIEDAPKWDDTEDILSGEQSLSPEEEMSQLEAAARGAAQGLTFDFGDEIAGAAQAGVGALQGEEGSIKELYQKYRDDQRKQMEQAAEEHPVTYYGSDIAAGVLPALLTGGATAAASVGGSLAKGAGKGALKQAIGKAALTGATFGAATGAGTSKSDVTEGDLGQLGIDTLIGGVAGGITGAGMPILGKGASKIAGKSKDFVKGAVKAIPGTEAIGLGYKAGKKGIGISQEDIIEEGLKIANKLNDKISKVLSKSGVERKKAMELADEAGKRINAGEVLDDVINDIIEEGAIGLDIKARDKLVQSISLIKEGFYEQLQANKIESKLYGQVAKDQALHGAEVETVSSINKNYDELGPIPDVKGKVKGLNAKMSVDTPDGKVYYNKVLTQPLDDTIVKRIEYDATNMKPTQLKSVIGHINDNLVGDLSKPAKDYNESKARELAVKLRGLLDDSVEEFADPTGTMRNTFRGAEKLGVKQAGRGTEQAIEDNIDSIAKKLLSTGTASDIDKQRAFKKFRQASPEYNEIIDEAEFISKLNDKLGGMTEGVRTTNVRGLLGTAEGAAAKLSNFAGKAVRNISEKSRPVTSKVNKVANKVGDMADPVLYRSSRRMINSDKKAVQEIGQQIQYALQQEGPIKSALIWSLSQNPIVRKMINEQEESAAEDLGFDPMTFETEETNTPEETTNYVERLDNVREPASIKEDNEFDHLDYITSDKIEGGYQNLQKDTGNFVENRNVGTNHGITPNAYKEFYGEYPTVEQMKKLSKEQAKEIYQSNYIDKPKFNLIEDEGLKLSLIDYGINSGPVQAIRDLQRIIGSEVDGIIGPNTLKKIEEYDGDIEDELHKKRIDLVNKSSEIDESLKPGILNRVNKVHNKADELQKAKDREAKQLGSGAMPGTERSSLDDLMGRLQEIDVNESQRAEMEQAAFGGDMNRLQELIDQYKGMVG